MSEHSGATHPTISLAELALSEPEASRRARDDKRAFFALWALTALSRFAAIAKSPWDWDEVEFMRGVCAYDVSLHAPHPPGYPVFIFIAKLIRPIAGSDFRALQSIVVASAIALFPVVFFLARELRFSTRTALLGATLTAFLPNVWFYGGTAMSDVPGLVLGLLACALLLHAPPRTAALHGALILGISIGIRPQNVLMALIPVARRKRAIAICAAVVIICYGAAALISPRYFAAIRAQQHYLGATDAAGAPDRLPLRQLFVPFFILPVDAPKLFIPITLLALIPIIRRRPPALLTVAMFLPFLLFAYLTLSQDAISRYAIGYVVMYALLAIDGLEWLCRKPALHVAASLILIGACAAWTWRPLQVVRTTPSPPFAAMQWITQHIPPGTALNVDRAFEPFTRYYLGAYVVIPSGSEGSAGAGGARNADLSAAPPRRPLAHTRGDTAWVVVDHDVLTRCANFRYERGRLWRVARQRNFVASVVASNQIPQFGDGWHPEEQGEAFSWRWMGRRATVTMPAFGRPATLEMVCDIPPITKRWPSDGLHPMTVQLSIEHPRHAPNDPRELGLRLRSLTWIPR
jgi:hypothetical protein